jgi:hypothetical protein
MAQVWNINLQTKTKRYKKLSACNKRSVGIKELLSGFLNPSGTLFVQLVWHEEAGTGWLAYWKIFLVVRTRLLRWMLQRSAAQKEVLTMDEVTTAMFKVLIT